MSRLDRGFESLDRADPPDLWEGIRSREPGPPPLGPSQGRRLGTVAVALAIAVAGVTFGIRAFRTDTAPVGPGTVNGVIAFTAIPDGTEIPQVYTVSPDGSVPTQLTEDPTIKGSLEWSPDGSELAFVSVDPEEEGFEVVSVMSADGSGRRVLCEGCSASILVASCADCGNTPDQVQPSSDALHWSPDGSQIAAPAYRRVGTDDYEDGINLIDVETGEPTFIRTGGSIQGLSWSPDGALLAVGVHGPDSALGGIFVLHRENLELRPLTGPDDLAEGASSPDRDPAWSPDGSQIAFIREVVVPSEGSRLSTEQIFVMRADGGEQRPLTSPEAISYPYDVVWRPDGQALTILAAPADTRGNGDDSLLFDATSSGSATSELMDCTDRAADTPCPSGDLAWSPDGTELAFRADGSVGDDDPAGFYVMSPGELPRSLSGDLSTGVDTAVACCFAWQGLTGTLSGNETSPRPEALPQGLTVELGEAVPVGDLPKAVAVGEGGVWLAVHTLEGQYSDVVRLDPRSGDIVARIAVTSLPGWEVGGGGLIAAAGGLWAVGSIDQEVGLTRIDPTTNEIAETIQFGRGSGADVWIDDSGIWILAFRAGGETEVLRLDHVTHEVVARIPLPASWAHQVVASNGSIWVHGTAPGVRGDVYPNTIYRIDPATNRLVDSSELPSPDFPLTADARAIWQRTRSGVARVDPAGQGVEARLETLRNGCCDLIVSDNSGGVWVIGRIAEDRRRIWHVTQEGLIDRTGPFSVAPGSGGIAAALDPQTLTFWTAQFMDTVTPISIQVE